MSHSNLRRSVTGLSSRFIVTRNTPHVRHLSVQTPRKTTPLVDQSSPDTTDVKKSDGNVRFPRSVQALYLKPLRREAHFGIPSCDLQLRSYSIRNLEFFCDFALRAAYYLDLPAFGPVPLPRITERWTVPRSSFIFKKSQENFERITLRRLIQIRDGNPESVQLWLAFLQKHAYYGIGMKANVWEFGPMGLGKSMAEVTDGVSQSIGSKWEHLAQHKTSKLSLTADTSLQDDGVKAALKLGLFSYPVLQAADVLVHRATHVPVGDDQRQHLEFARECANVFNNAYGQHLVVPQTLTSRARRVMSLQQPHKKMSKSSNDARSRILITDSPDEINQKLMSALTDCDNSVSYDPVNRPGVSNLLEILSIFDESGREPAQLAESLSGHNLKQLKEKVSESVVLGLNGIRERYIDLLSADEGKYLDFVEAEGARKARENAAETMAIVREATGL
ncbi:hypothetical protein BN1723_002019 [Verticillium longisporum]|uniref:Small ribosomal subunit protein uS10m n=1 Tax=Verticillium longisporum TaxID=100787 RepID=A0A0G4KVI2_VERLO|nr:hypothetical protein BN1723_002019 [Verticillium longisporum]